MGETKAVQETFVLGQIRDAMLRQVELSEQFVGEMKTLHKRVDGVKNELDQMGATMGEVNAKLETLKGQGNQGNQLLEQVASTHLEDVIQALSGLNDKLDVVKSNGQTSQGWLENVASSKFDALISVLEEAAKIQNGQKKLLEKGVEHNFEALSAQIQNLKNGLNTSEKQGDEMITKLGQLTEGGNNQLAQSHAQFDHLTKDLKQLLAANGDVKQLIEAMPMASLEHLEEMTQLQVEAQNFPFDTYKYLWSYTQFFIATQQHEVLDHQNNWVMIKAIGKDTDGDEFKREGWINTNAPESVWVVMDYEKVKKETEKKEEVKEDLVEA